MTSELEALRKQVDDLEKKVEEQKDIRALRERVAELESELEELRAPIVIRERPMPHVPWIQPWGPYVPSTQPETTWFTLSTNSTDFK